MGDESFRFLTPLRSVRNDSWIFSSQDDTQSCARVFLSDGEGTLGPRGAETAYRDTRRDGMRHFSAVTMALMWLTADSRASLTTT